jgi:hypothetical protein
MQPGRKCEGVVSAEVRAAELQADKEFVLGTVQENAVALQYAAAELQADKDFVLAAVKQNGVAVEYAAAEQIEQAAELWVRWNRGTGSICESAGAVGGGIGAGADDRFTSGSITESEGTTVTVLHHGVRA